MFVNLFDENLLEEEENVEQILSILVRNQPGVLMRVSGMFSRRGFNIDSLAVGITQNPEFSRMTVTMEADELTIVQVCKQLEKLVEVESVKVLPPKASAKRSMVMVKVHAGEKRLELLRNRCYWRLFNLCRNWC